LPQFEYFQSDYDQLQFPEEHGRQQGEGENGHFPPWNLGLRRKNFWKTWNQQFNSD